MNMLKQDQKSWDKSLTDRCAGSILASAAGDALGWITEFITSHNDLKSKMGLKEVTEYLSWSKRVGGRFQGYEDYINAGEYSDDTQLTICTAACICSQGVFDVDTFCRIEYPMWLEYARGAGMTVKEAAKKIQRKSAYWNTNFFTYKRKEQVIDYRNGGANGAAMRISPHVLANVGRWKQAEIDIWCNSIISHGHPRAIIGAILYGYALHTLLDSSNFIQELQLIEEIKNYIKDLQIPKEPKIQIWLEKWNKGDSKAFEKVFEETKQEAIEKLELIRIELGNKLSPGEMLKRLGCFNEATKGSGLGTVIAGIYLFARYPEKTEQNIITAANLIGSDTDSIAAFTGGLGGAAFGLEVISKEWQSKIQDREFLVKIGEHLAKNSQGEDSSMKIHPGLNNLNLGQPFSLAELESEMRIIHIQLGPGIITEIEEQNLLTQDKTATIVRITFDIGQTCKFVFRSDVLSKTLFRNSI
jgi:ADP-ribosylglycohydrolase